MNQLFVTLLAIILFQTSTDAADKVRISIANLSGQFMTLLWRIKEVSQRRRDRRRDHPGDRRRP
jgi:hypothetical protein